MVQNQSKSSLLKNSIMAAGGLVLFGFGVYLTIQANLGVAPWDAFCLGLSNTFGIQYGTASIMISLIILCIDIILREKIGFGMLLDAFIVGKTVDLCNFMNIVSVHDSPILSFIVIFAGMIIMGFSQFLYMSAGLGCGPRDTLLVGLSRKLPKIPIGLISVAILAFVTLIGWLLRGKLGIGTILCAFLEGPIMQLAFRAVHFVPTSVKHQSIAESMRVLINVSARSK